MSDVYLGAFDWDKARQTFKQAGDAAADLKAQTGDTGNADVGSGTSTPRPSDVVSDKPSDVGGGSAQKSDPTIPKKDENKEDDNKDAKDLLKISAPILLLGAAAAFYFFYLRKKK